MGPTRCGGGALGGAEPRRRERGGFSGKVPGAAGGAGDSGPILGVPTSSPRGGPPPSGAFPGRLFPVAPQPETPPHPPFQAQRPPAPNTVRIGRPGPPPSLPPHLKPPAPRWAPPCGNCPWRRRHGRPPGAAETGTDSSRQPALAPAAPRAAPSQSRRPLPAPPPASAPPRPRPRRKWGGGGRGRLGERGRRRSAWVGNALYCTRGGGAGPSPEAPGKRPSAPTGRPVTAPLPHLSSIHRRAAGPAAGPRFKSQSLLFLAVRPWASPLTSVPSLVSVKRG